MGLYNDISSIVLRTTLNGETNDYPIYVADSGKKSSSLFSVPDKITKRGDTKADASHIAGFCIIRKYNYQDLTISIESEDFGDYELPLSVAMVDFDGSQYPCLVAESDDEVVNAKAPLHMESSWIISLIKPVEQLPAEEPTIRFKVLYNKSIESNLLKEAKANPDRIDVTFYADSITNGAAVSTNVSFDELGYVENNSNNDGGGADAKSTPYDYYPTKAIDAYLVSKSSSAVFHLLGCQYADVSMTANQQYDAIQFMFFVGDTSNQWVLEYPRYGYAFLFQNNINNNM